MLKTKGPEAPFYVSEKIKKIVVKITNTIIPVVSVSVTNSAERFFVVMDEPNQILDLARNTID